MKLLRFGELGSERPGLLDRGGRIRDLSGVIDDIAGVSLTPEGLDRLRALDPDRRDFQSFVVGWFRLPRGDDREADDEREGKPVSPQDRSPS